VEAAVSERIYGTLGQPGPLTSCSGCGRTWSRRLKKHSENWVTQARNRQSHQLRSLSREQRSPSVEPATSKAKGKEHPATPVQAGPDDTVVLDFENCMEQIWEQLIATPAYARKVDDHRQDRRGAHLDVVLGSNGIRQRRRAIRRRLATSRGRTRTGYSGDGICQRNRKLPLHSTGQ